MIQVKTFMLPDEEQEANDFLATHRPAGPINFNHDKIFVFFDDGTYPSEYEISEWDELLNAQRSAIHQQEVILHTLEFQRADVNPTKNKNKYDDLTNGILQTRTLLDSQQQKMSFVQSKIDALRQPAPQADGQRN